MRRLGVIAGGILMVAALVPESIAAGKDTAEAPVLLRQRPIDVSWGEVAITDLARIEAPFKGGSHPFPNGLGLEFTLRHRTELDRPGVTGESEVKSTAEPVASFWIVAESDGGDAAWRSYRDAVVKLVTRLSPAGYDRFLNDIGGRLDLMGNAPFRFTACISRPNGDVALNGNGTYAQEAGNAGHTLTSVYTTLADPVPVCSALRRAATYAPRTSQVTSTLNLASSVEERVNVAWVSRRGEDLIKLPPRASARERASAPGAPGFETSDTTNGSSHHEELALEEDGIPAVVVITDASPTEIPSSITRGRSVLAKWSIDTKRLVFGAEPAESGSGSTVVYQGAFFFQEPKRWFDFDVYRVAVAREITARAGDALSDLPESLDRALPAAILRSALIVTCRDPGNGDFESRYCVGRACARVTNAVTFCDALSREFAARAQ